LPTTAKHQLAYKAQVECVCVCVHERERESERERYAMHRDAGGWVGAGAVGGITTGHGERGAASKSSWGARNGYGTTEPYQGWGSAPGAERDMGQRYSAGVLTYGGDATHGGALIYGGGAHANSMLVHAPAAVPGPSSTRPPGSQNFVGGFESHGDRADARCAQGAPVGRGGGEGVRADGSQVLWAGLVVCALTSSICSDLQEHYDIRLHPSLMKQVSGRSEFASTDFHCLLFHPYYDIRLHPLLMKQVLKFHGELVVPRVGDT
jgi:hypothetical protein